MLSQRAKYALKAMICLAENSGPEPMSVTEIYHHLSVSELKIYQAAHQLIRSGHLTMSGPLMAEMVA